MAGKIPYIDLAAKFFPVQSRSSPKPSVPSKTWTVNNRLTSDVSSKQLLAAAKEYFISSDNWKDPRMKLAEKCVDLASGLTGASPGVSSTERRLVEAIKVLHALGVDASPLDLWTSGDKFKFVKLVLDGKAEAYRHPDRLRALARVLGVEDMNRVSEAVAEKAFERRDFSFCRELCERLIEENRKFFVFSVCFKIKATSFISRLFHSLISRLID